METILYALIGGVFPALVWLFFWLREDSRHPEPKRLILKTFLLGMGAVVLVLPAQKAINALIPGISALTMFIWVTFEEIFKFGAAYWGGLKSRDDNEPIDPIIYMITAALGFVALENVLFLVGPIIGNDVGQNTFFITSNLRFIGASLLHVVSSGIIGISLAFSFYHPKRERLTWVLISMISAILIHTAFNLAIIYWDNVGIILSFLTVWVGVVGLLLTFEKVKLIAR